MEAALTLNDWIRSLNDGGLAPSSDQLVNSIKQYYSNQPTPREYMINGVYAWVFALVVIIVIWEFVWKAIGLWKAGRNNQLVWFILILVILSPDS